nr:hypothetical protein YSBCXYJI_YSBCXYJI_CDS_0165 [Caudoviricetes sp.]
MFTEFTYFCFQSYFLLLSLIYKVSFIIVFRVIYMNVILNHFRFTVQL